MRIAIYGAGSIGTVLGAYLTKAGVQVDLVNHNIAHVQAMKERGARIVGTVDFVVPVRALMPEEMTGAYDVVFLMTKQLDNRRVVAGLVPFLGERGVVCTMQNGLPEPSVAELVGADRTFGCAVGWGATLRAPGVVELTSAPTREALAFSLGSMSGRTDGTLQEIAAVLGLMGDVRIEANFMGARWAKLLVNAAFSGLGTCIGGTYGDVSDDKAARYAAQKVIKECIDVARGSGVAIEPIQGKDIVKVFDYNNALKRLIGFMIIPIAIKKHRAIRPSMLQDLEKGKRTEIDAINGAVAAQGDRIGFPTPYNDLVVTIVKELESGKGKPGREQLARFAALRSSR